VLHISIWGVETFVEGLSGDWTEFWAPVTACPPNWGILSAADAALRTVLCLYNPMILFLFQPRNDDLLVFRIFNT